MDIKKLRQQLIGRLKKETPKIRRCANAICAGSKRLDKG